MMHGRDVESAAPVDTDTDTAPVSPGTLSPGTLSTGTAAGGPHLESVAVFCGNCSCGCPELFLDHGAEQARRVVLTDDFGQRVQMSLEQLTALVADVKSGTLDHLVG